MTRIAHVVHEGGRAREAWLGWGGQWVRREPTSASVAATLRNLAADPGGDGVAWLSWGDQRYGDLRTALRDWIGRVRVPQQILHAGAQQQVWSRFRRLGLVELDDPALLPVSGSASVPSWLVGSAAGIAPVGSAGHLPVLRAPSAAVELAVFGWRARQAGWLPTAVPLLPGGEGSGAERAASSSGARAEAARVVRQIRGARWLLFWLLAATVADRRPPLLATLRALLLGKSAKGTGAPPEVTVPTEVAARVAVVIPSLARRRYLERVLACLAAQDRPPDVVVVVEQEIADSPDTGRWVEEVDYPSLVLRGAVPWAGACRSRNLALARCVADADWILFLDDDVEFGTDLMSSLLGAAAAHQAGAVLGRVRRPDQPAAAAEPSRSCAHFAGCCALVSSSLLQEVDGFDERLDRGYGEDYELGVRLRLAGGEVVVAGDTDVLHHQAPSGGFRSEMSYPWSRDEVQPKPAPSVMLSRTLHATREMQLGWRLVGLLLRLRQARPWAWPAEARRARRQWHAARRWCAHLEAGPRGGIETWRRRLDGREEPGS